MSLNERKFVEVILACILLWLSFTTIDGQQQKCIYVKSTGFLDCRNKNLTSVPILPADTRVLDLSHNNIQRLNQNSFNSCLSVTEVYLANNSIKSLHYSTFEKLSSLRILDLSDNLLQNVFTDLPVSLEILYLDRNPLSSEYIFQQRLHYLKYLSLDGANLTRIPNFAQILPVLRYLNLDNNAGIQITDEDLRSLKTLQTLTVSQRVFGGRAKADRCNYFGKFARQRNIEVKNLECHNNKNFDLLAKSFVRDYTNNEVVYEGPDAVLNWNVQDANLFDLRSLISNGLANFFKALLVEKREAEETGAGKIREPIKMDDYVVKNPELALRNVFLSGFPLFKNVNQPQIGLSSSDPADMRRFKIGYKSAEDGRSMVLSGIFNFYTKVYRFSCELTEAVFKFDQNLMRMNDFTVKPMRTEQTLQFEKKRCTLNESSDRVTDDILMNMMTDALSKYWLDHAVNVAHAGLLDHQIKNYTSQFTNIYKRKLLSTLVLRTIDYLRTLNINSFDVSPTAHGSLKDNSLDMLFENQVYNIKIFNLFNHSDYNTTYKMSNEMAGNTFKVPMTTTVFYPVENSAILAISSKQDPNEVITFYIKNVEVNTVFELKTINKVTKVRPIDVSVKLIEVGEQKRDPIVIQILKKYLNLELSKEFQRALTFLMSEIDFESLNL
ncbi:uncharacterized protein LOC135846645 [Planococcus citri]|uniref:uncharacterized protein LOC135846645 n=1 Tax=Planococcus citri TaxID=170843 RepID=UPI0031FA1D7A